jgi:acyl carrier protein
MALRDPGRLNIGVLLVMAEFRNTHQRSRIVSIPVEAPAPSRGSIEEWLICWIAKELGMPPEGIETSKSLLDYSLSSVTAMMLVGDLEEWLGLTLPPTLVWDYPSIAAIADYLTEQVGSSPAAVSAATEPGNGRPMDGEPNGRPAAGADLYASLDRLSDQEVDALLSRMMAEQNAGASS